MQKLEAARTELPNPLLNVQDDNLFPRACLNNVNRCTYIIKPAKSGLIAAGQLEQSVSTGLLFTPSWNLCGKVYCWRVKVFQIKNLGSIASFFFEKDESPLASIFIKMVEVLDNFTRCGAFLLPLLNQISMVNMYIKT